MLGCRSFIGELLLAQAVLPPSLKPFGGQEHLPQDLESGLIWGILLLCMW